MKRKIFKMWLASVGVGIASLMLLSCQRESTVSDDRTVVNNGSEGLVYDFKYIDEDGDVEESKADLSSVYGFVSNYCKWYVLYRWNPGEYSTNEIIPKSYRDYREWLCIAESFESLVSSVEPSAFERHHHLKGTMEIEFDIASFDTSLFGTNQLSNEIVFGKFDNSGKEAEIYQVASTSYINALNTLMGVVLSAEKRCDYYSLIARDVIYEDYGDTSIYALFEQALGSLPNLIEKVWSLKTELAETYLALGAESGQEWTSESVGRIPALRQLMGNVDAPNYGDWSSYSIPRIRLSIPAGIDVPSLNNDLTNAISVVSKFVPDFLEIQKDGHEEIGDIAFYNKIKETLLDNANDYRINTLGQDGYSNISELYLEYGTSAPNIKNAINYMYSHMFRFPRTAKSETPSDVDSFTLSWENKYTKLPWFYYTRSLSQTIDSESLMINMGYVNASTGYYMGLPNEVGLGILLIKMDEILRNTKSIYEDNKMEDEFGATTVSEDCPTAVDVDRAVRIEDKIEDYLREAQDNLAKKLGGNFDIEIRVENTGSSNYNLFDIEVEQCDEFRAKVGIEDPTDQIQVRLFSINGYSGVDSMTSFACSRYGIDDAYCEQFHADMREAFMPYDPIENSCLVSLSDVPAGKDYIIEYLDHETDDSGKWTPIYIVRKQEYTDDGNANNDSRSERVLYGGELLNAVQRVLAYNDQDLNSAACVPLNDLGDECLDRDWVPAIDNETIDTTGDQYETSYQHYLDIARVAANQARTLRDELMNDIITESHDAKVEQAQEDAAIDAYYNNISEICGYDIAIEKEAIQRVVQNYDGTGTLEEKIEDLWKLDRTDTALDGEQRLGEYGCAGDGESRFGPVQCAVKRNCSVEDATTVGQILPDRTDETTMKNNQTKIVSVTNDYLRQLAGLPFDELFGGLKVETEDLGTGDALYVYSIQQVDRVLSGLYSYLKIAFSAIDSMAMYQWPMIETVWDENENSPVYGAYYQKINEIDVARNDLSTAVNSYKDGFVKAILALKKVKTALNVLRSEAELQEGTNIAQALMQATNLTLSMAQNETNISQPYENCIEAVREKYEYYNGGPHGCGIADMEEMLRQLNLQYSLNRQLDWGWMETRDSYYEICRESLSATGHPLIVGSVENQEYLCNYFAYNNEWFVPKYESWMYYDNNIPRVYQCYIGRLTQAEGYEGAGPTDVVDLHGWILMRNLLAEDLENKQTPATGYEYTRDDVTKSGGPKTFQYCAVREDPSWGRWPRNRWQSGCDIVISLNDICDTEDGDPDAFYYVEGIEEAAADLWNAFEYNEFLKCVANYGCKPGTDSDGVANWAVSQCDGMIVDEYNDAIAKQNEITGEIEELLKQVAVAKFADVLQETSTIMNDAVNSLVVGKNEVETQIKKMANRIGDLNSLEERQIKELQQLENSIKTNKAAEYSSLTEWNERYQYRKDEYQKQLSRAKIAAWTARRAIEFRFGIDLSEETTRSLYGDIPQEWADDIFVAGQSKCGDNVGEEYDTDNDTKLTACLSPEDRIEDYVQKLEDYVASYGNTPGQDWWFHEDDDTGVISLRDHIAVNNIDANAEVKNLLFFSEEANMSEEKFMEDYEEIESRFATPGGEVGQGSELAYPSFWQGNAVTESETSVTDALGVPSDVHSEHLDNDAAAYDDQLDENTAELVRLYSDENPDSIVELYQTVDLSEVEAEARIGSSQMEFSAYMRKAPVETECASGETYFSEYGRCGIACDIEETTPCPNAGQQCVFAGFSDDDSAEDEDLSLYMCAWCDADRSCMGQDGTVASMQLEVEYNDDEVTAAKNVPITREWMRNTVNTLSDRKSIQLGPEKGDATVRLTGTETQNLARFSEKVDMDAGWTVQPTTFGSYSSEMIESPEGHIAARYAELSGDEASQTAGSLNFNDLVNLEYGYYTVSMWLKLVEGSTQTQQTERVKILTGITQTIANETFIIDNTWKRVELKGFNDTTGLVDFTVQVIPEDISYDGVNQVAVWGLQIEKGTQATVYIPTGKNRVPSTTVDTDWTTSGATVSRVTDLRAPDGHTGTSANIFAVADEDLATAGYIEYQATPLSADTTATFSVWMRAGDSAPTQATMYLESVGAGVSNTLNIDSLTSDWQRFDVSIEAASIADMTVRIYPAGSDPLGVGQIEIWAPQAELNPVATGYQATGTDVDANTVKWKADIGFVGAQLSEIGAFSCDELGQPAAGAAVKSCPVPDAEYTRNTYVRKHYDDRFVVENNSGAAYPMPSELTVYLSDEERTRLFKNQFTKVEADGSEPGYYVFKPFTLDMDRIAAGDMGMFGVLAANNFNYRLRTTAVNMVGTDVINCDNADSPTTCAANNWLIYDLKQFGDVHIRNHHKEKSVRPFKIPTGRITGGKAWTAEQVIGYPISGTHQSMLGQLQKVSLMGRPLEGSYELRIYDTPELDWDNVEDIQLVLGYHYWTRSE